MFPSKALNAALFPLDAEEVLPCANSTRGIVGESVTGASEGALETVGERVKNLYVG